MPAQLFLHQLQLGPMQNFVYLVGTEGERDVLVVDPAWDVDAIEKTCTLHGKRLCGILLTHSHKDHTNGVGELLGHRDLRTTMIYTHVANRGPLGVTSPADRL